MNHVMNVDMIIINGGRLIAGQSNSLTVMYLYMFITRFTNCSIQWHGRHRDDEKFSNDHPITIGYASGGTQNDQCLRRSRFKW